MCPQTLTPQIPLSLWGTPPFSGLAGDDLGAWPQQGASAALEAASPPPPRAARRRREPGAEGLGVPQPEGRTGETAIRWRGRNLAQAPVNAPGAFPTAQEWAPWKGLRETL